MNCPSCNQVMINVADTKDKKIYMYWCLDCDIQLDLKGKLRE